MCKKFVLRKGKITFDLSFLNTNAWWSALSSGMRLWPSSLNLVLLAVCFNKLIRYQKSPRSPIPIQICLFVATLRQSQFMFWQDFFPLLAA